MLNDGTILNSMPVDWSSEAFKKQHRRLWTGTNISNIACPVWGGAISVWLEKRGYEKEITKPMQDGIELEPIAFEDIKSILLEGLYIEGEFIKAVAVWQPLTLYWREDIGASPDVMARLVTGEIIIIELKIAQNLTDWRWYDTPRRVGRVTKTYQQVNHYGYVMGIRRSLIFILNLEFLKWHVFKKTTNINLAVENIKKAKRSLKMLGKKKADEILAEAAEKTTGKMDLKSVKDNIKKVNFGMKRIVEKNGLKKDVFDYPAEGAKKTVFIEDTPDNQTLLATLATVTHTIDAATEKKERIEALLLSRINGSIGKGIPVELQLNKASESFNFTALKDDGFEDNLRNSEFKDYFKFSDGAFKVVIAGAKK